MGTTVDYTADDACSVQSDGDTGCLRATSSGSTQRSRRTEVERSDTPNTMCVGSRLDTAVSARRYLCTLQPDHSVVLIGFSHKGPDSQSSSDFKSFS